VTNTRVAPKAACSNLNPSAGFERSLVRSRRLDLLRRDVTEGWISSRRLP
jgi:hypothetical protein